MRQIDLKNNGKEIGKNTFTFIVILLNRMD